MSESDDLQGPGVIAEQGRRRPGLVRQHPVIAVAGLIVVIFLIASAVLFVWPATDQPRRVDAILSLNGSNEVARESKAIALAKQGYAPLLLFSRGGNKADTGCPRVSGVTVVCFVARPDATIGEMKWAANYARNHGVHSLMIVSGRAQVTEVRLLIGRCFSGQILMIPAPFQLLHFPYDVLYGWGGLAKAVITDEHC